MKSPAEAFSPPKTFDYVLVAPRVEEGDQKAQRQIAFIQELEKKKISITVSLSAVIPHSDTLTPWGYNPPLLFLCFCQRIEHDDKVFFGLRAPVELFKSYQYLLKVSDSCNSYGDVKGNVSQATR